MNMFQSFNDMNVAEHGCLLTISKERIKRRCVVAEASVSVRKRRDISLQILRIFETHRNQNIQCHATDAVRS